MSFRFEKDMTSLLLKNMNDLFNKFELNNFEKYMVRAEHPVHARIIDLFIFTWEKEFEKNEFLDFKNQLEKLEAMDLAILSIFTYSKTTSVRKITNMLYIEYLQAKHVLDKLVTNGYLCKVSNYSYCAVNDWIRFVPRDSISIELKKSKWKEALGQGVSNKNISDYSIVILDEDELPKRKEIESYFSSEKITMFTIKEDGQLFAKVKQKRSNAFHYFNSYEKLRILKKIDVN